MFNLAHALKENLLEENIQWKTSPIDKFFFDTLPEHSTQGSAITTSTYSANDINNISIVQEDNTAIILTEHHALGLEPMYATHKNMLLFAPIGITSNDTSMQAHILSYIQAGWKVRKPRSSTMLQTIVNMKGKHYIPYSDKELEPALDTLEYGGGVLDMKQIDYSGPDACIITISHLLGEVSWASKHIQLQADIFALYRYDHKWTPRLRESIRNHSHIILIIDMNPHDPYIQDMQNQIRHIARSKKTISHIQPQYENITSIHSEYIQEQAGYDHYGLAKQLEKRTK